VLLVFALVQACGGSDEPLPPVHRQTLTDTCTLPLPPPPPPPAGLELAVIARGTDPAHCLPPHVRRKGLLVDVELSSRGRPRSVAAAHAAACLVIGANGEPVPQYGLTPAAEECILEDLRSWRFAAGDPCQAHGTLIELIEPRSERSATAALHVSGSCGG
jgi:hypothetical protein